MASGRRRHATGLGGTGRAGHADHCNDPGPTGRRSVWQAVPVSSPRPDEHPDARALQLRAARVLAALPPAALELGRAFDAAGFELALVGGPVRDAFLGRTSADLDFATSASPDETQRLLARWGDAHWDIGRAFGTIGARRFAAGDEPDIVAEVTTYRSDVYDPESRKPVVAFGDNLLGDLSRRDFTVNA
ncbi:MAG: hypothetical protein KJ548_11200, partial [Actinobacteria bacterium]|nr:hypothetical protein [Actinomycetota bacterium]